MAAKKLQLYGDITKFEPCDDGSLIVEGIASSEAVDADGEIITADAMRKAIPAFMQAPAVREMHDNIAAGKVLSAFVDDDGNTHVRAKIVDQGTVQKIKDKVLRGFSIFGKAIKREGKKITELVLKTIDVVDLPNNPKAWFEIIKFDKPGDKCDDPECESHTEGHVGKCAKCMGKSKVMKSDDEISESRKNEKSMKKMITTALALPEDASDETISKALGDALKRPEATAPTVKLDGQDLPLGDALSKVLQAVGDIKKMASEADAKAAGVERNAIISKMDSEGRVAFNSDTGIAYTPDELSKLDIGLLKFAAKNSPVLPTQARAIYKGSGKPIIDPSLKGSDLIQKSWESDYGDLNAMRAKFIRGN